MPHGNLPLLYTFFFYVFGLMALVAALLFVTRKSPVAAVMWLVVTMFNLAALYVLLDAQFIGVMQVLVYAGAIMVVFLFVIMLLNLGEGEGPHDIRGIGWKLVAGLFAIGILAEVFALTRSHVVAALSLPTGYVGRQVEDAGAIAPIAAPMFREYLLAFEVTSVLLLAAVVGAVMLGKRRSLTDAG